MRQIISSGKKEKNKAHYFATIITQIMGYSFLCEYFIVIIM